MYSLPKEIHQEIVVWLEPEEQQITRLVSRYFAGLIQPQDVNLLEFGAKRGLLEYCEIGLSRGNPKKRICSIAAKHGHLDILVWARSQDCPWGPTTCSRAAKHGHLEVLKWARSQGCPWNMTTCFYAAESGHLEVLKWVRGYSHSPTLNQGEGINPERNEDTICPWNYWTCSAAARNGHLEVLQWAREHGCEWGSTTCMYAAQYNHLEVLQWAYSNGCPWNPTNNEISFYSPRIQEYVRSFRW